MAEFQNSIEIEAPPQAIFEYFTTNEGMTTWAGQYVNLDPTPGGQFVVDVVGYPVRGEYLVVKPSQRVVVSWGLTGGDGLPTGASRVELILTPIAAGTRVNLRHLDLPEPVVPGHVYSWAHFIPRLKVAGAGGDAGLDRWQSLTD